MTVKSLFQIVFKIEVKGLILCILVGLI